MEISTKILEQTENYFQEKRDQFGTTVKGLDWNSETAQSIRFEQLTNLLKKEREDTFSLCDYGCGYGDYFGYLQEKGYHCKYTGMDLIQDSVSCARQKYGRNPDALFVQGAKLQETYDYIVESGIFNIKGTVKEEEWEKYVIGILEEFNSHAKKGFAFNCLTKYSDAEYMKDHLYYADPLFYFDYAKKHFSRNAALLHDYELYDFTIIVRK